MKDLALHISVKILLYWYIFIFFSTEFLSYFHLLGRNYILLGEIFFWAFFLFFHHQEILKIVQRINFRSKSLLLILTLFLLNFIQGFFSAPNTTDSMVYHLPRVMYWVQEKTLQQDVIRNLHDFMAPFAEYILLHLYFIGGGDRLLFFSQWVAYVALVILSLVIAEKLGAGKKIKVLTALFVVTLPIAVMQASSTQVDMVVAVLVMISTYIALTLLEKITINKAILFALTLGLGISTKATFFLFIIIPLGIMLFALIKNQWKNNLIIVLSGLITMVMPLRFMNQNLSLYGNILGPFKKEGGVTLTNDSIDLITLISNLIRNIMIHIPIPFFTTQVQSFLEFIHNIIGVSISASQTTCCDFQFHVIPLLYPQEDIVSNPLHLLLILIAIIFILKKGVIKDKPLILVYILSLFSFVIFSLILKWQPFHSRLQIPFFVIGTISSVLILSKFKEGLYILKGTLVLSVFLAILLIFLNVSRPFISYTSFYDKVKSFSFPLSGIPQSFLIKPREQQYFNARYYWYEPYLQVTSLLIKQNNPGTIAFNLMDDFEYPLWVFIQKNYVNIRVIPYSRIDADTLILSTTPMPFYKEGYYTACIKTQIDYGYACLSKIEKMM